MSKTINNSLIYTAWRRLIGTDAAPLSVGPAYPLPIIDLTPQLEEGRRVKRMRVWLSDDSRFVSVLLPKISLIQIDLTFRLAGAAPSNTIILDFYNDGNYSEHLGSWMDEEEDSVNRGLSYRVQASIPFDELLSDDLRLTDNVQRAITPQLVDCYVASFGGQSNVYGTIDFYE